MDFVSERLLIPDSDLVTEGSGVSRTLNAMPRQSGTATFTLSVSDGEDKGTLLVKVQRAIHGFPPGDEIRPFRM
ncbi:MAG: hypothetical protein M3254_03730 [Actinomycetota bacterium]|jgi:hypothetical protein|nr:hypothetical protein [Actinomycetota bacterium]